MAHEKSEIQMPKNNQLEKVCPECEEEMHPIYDKSKVLACWECTECGKLLSATKEAKNEKI
jgi:hypothetical protein